MRYHFAPGLALLGAFLLLATIGVAGCGGASTAQNVTVTLYDNWIQSSQMTFTPGMRYHFTVMNKGAVNHELMLMPQGMSQMPMEQMDSIAPARTGDLAPGMMKTFDYSFTPAMAQQHLEFACYYPGHYDAGMHMSIAVGK
jgi:uncharacterized cupredoxin-like copper-binding protein